MRADRLVATLLLLQSRGRVTAAELAEELETSVATSRRDLEALSAAGIPVYPQSGRNGGWQLLGGARTDLSGLTSDETRALFLLVGPAASLDPAAKSALRKLVRALPSTFRSDAEAAAAAVVIDPDAWGGATRERPAFLDELQDAVVRRRRVTITYSGWNREAVERTVDPWGLVDKDSRWYLLGGIDGAERTYRVDRISALAVTNEPAERPADFDLADAWNRVASDVEGRRASYSATLLVDAAIVPYLREALGAQAVAEEPLDDHHSRVVATSATELGLCRAVAGWAEYFTVIQPDTLRHELTRLGARLVERNEL